MKRYLFLVFLIVIFVEIYSVLPSRTPQSPLSAGQTEFPQGVVHFHSNFSYDAQGTIPEIIAAARKTGMDFAILTDHNTQEARRQGFEKNYEGVDLFIEMEVSTPAGHLISFFSHTPAKELRDDEIVDLTWSHILEKKGMPGMFVALAHPSNIKNPWTRLDLYPDGLEVVNLDSAWQRQLFNSSMEFSTTVFLLPWNLFLSTLRFNEVFEKDFSVWDDMNTLLSSTHRVFGIAGLDTHQRLILRPGWEFKWPDYLSTFKLVSLLIMRDKKTLPEDFKSRKLSLYQNIQKGELAIVFPFIFPANGNDWFLKCGDAELLRSGSISNFVPGCEFVTMLPAGFPYAGLLRLMRNGSLYKELTITGEPVRVPLTEPGIYRAEIWMNSTSLLRVFLNKRIPYILYNPIYVR